MHRLLAALAAAAVLLTLHHAGATPPPACADRPGGHAHNDYYHDRPLLDALDQGFVSFEADVFCIDADLLLGHDRHEVRTGRTLRALYLEPLAERARANAGRIYADRDCPVVLLVDVKDDAEQAYELLEAMLEDYADVVTEHTPDGVIRRAVTVVISGRRATGTARGDEHRRVFIDGRFRDRDHTKDAALIPLVSDSWTSHFAWRGDGPMPGHERERLERMVAQAHARGQLTRFWGGAADKPAIWKAQILAGVDLINTDRLEHLPGVLEAVEPSPPRLSGSTLLDEAWAPELVRAPRPAGAIVAHRGACKFAPENTFAAAELCARWGFDWVEVDVRTTSDGVLIVMHDHTLDRTTDGCGPVRARTAAEIAALDAGSWFGPEFAGEPVPRLDEFVAWARGAGIGVYFDVKDADPAAILDIVERQRMRDRVFFWSGDRAFMHALRELDPTIAIKVNPKDPADLASLVRTLTPQIAEFRLEQFTPEDVRRVHDLGMKAMVYSTGNRPDLFRKALDAGVDLFNIDHVDSFVEVELKHARTE